MVAASVEFHSVDFQFATTSFKREIELGKSEGDWTNGLLGTPNLLMLLAFFVANRASTSCCAIHSEGEPGSEPQLGVSAPTDPSPGASLRDAIRVPPVAAKEPAVISTEAKQNNPRHHRPWICGFALG